MRIKNWERFQQYKDRRPPWIKLYRELLDDPEWHKLSGEDAKNLILFWLIASEYDGNLPSVERLAFRTRRPESEIIQTLQHLVPAWLIADDSEAVAWKNPFPSRYVSDELRTSVLERDGNACIFCESKENLEIDHIVPVSKGGQSEIENLQVLCRSCNRKKRTRVANATQKINERNPETERETEKEGEAESEKKTEKEVAVPKTGTAESASPKAKRPPAPFWALLIDHIKRKWEYKKRPYGRFTMDGKDAQHLHRKIAVYDAFTLMALYDEFVVTDDPFWSKNGHKVWVFCGAIDFLLDKPGWKAKADKYRSEHVKPVTSEEKENVAKVADVLSQMTAGKVSTDIEKKRKDTAHIGGFNG